MVVVGVFVLVRMGLPLPINGFKGFRPKTGECGDTMEIA